ncbi:IclR family transcriptional regulator [Achromobacter aloeverae]|uniref:IclR family transcriptional regulator n=2 Tax=Achromobacter aloeverae TaxID=1750518 RepID=A0A4Q1HDB0_9BURK|nr:IclR family transcriptional regulator [Achromobacter aloeverae]
MQSFRAQGKPEVTPAAETERAGDAPVAAVGRDRAGRRRRSVAAEGGKGAERSADFITALARGLQVLRCFQSGSGALGNLELARLTGLPKATLSRITYTLMELGYLRYDRDSGRYAPGHGVLALGLGLLSGLEVRQLAKPAMQSLAQQTGAALALGTCDGDAMAYVEAIHGSSALYLRLPVGCRVSMDSAMGRAYLALLAPAARRDLLLRLGPLAPLPDVVDRCVADLAATGCCFAIGEWQSGINAAAAPFESATGEGIFVISCGGPATLLPESVLRDEVAPILRRTAQSLSRPPQ